MFRKLRRSKQELSREESISLLESIERGFLSLLGDDDYPYVLPLNYVYHDNSIYFHGAKEGHKVDAIKNHSKASFAIINKGQKQENEWWNIFKSVIVFGKMELITNEEELDYALKILGEKYHPTKEYTENEIKKYKKQTQGFKLNIEHISGKIVNEK